MERRNLRMTLSYDGTDFLGWERQAEGRTVQGVVEAALAELHGHPVDVSVAGRTDSGVHALGQVINFRTDASIPDERFPYALNALLPKDVRAIGSFRVSDAFHARFDAVARVYAYYFQTGEFESPIDRRFAWHLRREPSLPALNSLAASIVGTHDFTTFAAAGDASQSRVRDIFTAAFYREGRHLVFRIAGNAFLYRMVRSLVGTMIDFELTGAGPPRMREILQARERGLAGPTAPPNGLFLLKVVYDGEPL